jgi:fatty-acyl-CoA synthase
LGAGGSLVLQPTFNAEEALELMQKEKVNFPIAWPHQWAQLEAAPNWQHVDLSAMRFADHKFAIAKHPTAKAPFYSEPSAYGNTETFTLSAAFPASTPVADRAGAAGKPLVGMTFKITDALTGEVVPIGERGEICVKGATLMLGYVGTPLEESLDHEGFFPTGDGGYFDAEGRLYWEGRLTDIIKTGGANVSPLEVDEVIAKIPGVKVAKTVGVPHDLLGEVVVTCIVPHEGVTLEAENVRKLALEKLASYKAPRHVLFFREDEIALTGSAKIKAGDVKQLAAARLQGA